MKFNYCLKVVQSWQRIHARNYDEFSVSTINRRGEPSQMAVCIKNDNKLRFFYFADNDRDGNAREFNALRRFIEL